MTILGIETSCDETAAAVVRDGRDVLSSVVYSQVPLHQPYGGVVPEIASRSHVEKLPGVIVQAMEEARLDGGPVGQSDSGAVSERDRSTVLPTDRPTVLHWSSLDAIAVTYGPGLASSLIVGLAAAKGLALRLNKPLIGINHIEAHIHSVFLTPGAPVPEEAYPMLALVVSGGHSMLVDTPQPGVYRVIGQTLDDAAGEAFDKAAQLLGLGYPGGPAIDRAARQATPRVDLKFPQGRVRAGHHLVSGDLRAELCVSFSGLKTALMYHLRNHPVAGPEDVNAIAASYQEAIVDALADRCDRALRGGRYRCLAVGGGVSLNARLRVRLQEVAESRHVRLLLALPKYCGDNAAMIAGLAGAGCGVRGPAALSLDATPSLALHVACREMHA
ncbi:MAG: tRNA (adenosine(37)-N6)-threonylcarbamoyltransferase complex transferase subunit TsaD [Kiritimatiellia bacterium]